MTNNIEYTFLTQAQQAELEKRVRATEEKIARENDALRRNSRKGACE